MRFRTRNKIIAAGILSLSAVLLLVSLVAAGGPGTINILGFEIDRDRVAVPPDRGAPLTKQLEIQAAYNGEDILFRARFPSDNPGIHHDYMVYEGGAGSRISELPRSVEVQ